MTSPDPLAQLRAALQETARALTQQDAVEAARALGTAGAAVLACRAAGLTGDAACVELHRECERLAASLRQLLTTQVGDAGLSSRAQHAYRRTEATGG